MPLVEIAALPQPEGVDVPSTLDRVRLATASGMGCDADAVWVTWRPIEPGHYCVRGRTPHHQERDSHDPIVRLSAYHGRSDETIARTLEAIARTLGGALGLDASNVFVIYQELEPGRVFMGGAVRT